jgi:hypothetical protein
MYWGVVAEIVPNGKAIARARELASLYLKAPEVTRRPKPKLRHLAGKDAEEFI